jgi:3-deoxy-D-manno-octulosonic-acid transferase
MLRQEMTAPGRLWLMLRYLDQQGCGKIRIDILRKTLTHKSSTLHICGKRQLRNLLRDGEGLSPLIVYVPRAPERFGAVADGLRAAGLTVVRRSATLDDTLATTADFADVDILLGDSLGEMFFYLALADRVIVGGGFNPRGAHNIIEPLMMNKTVLTGPHTWTIEFPFVEAEAAGIATSLSGQTALLDALKSPTPDEPAKIADFLAQHKGASARTLAAIDEALAAENADQHRQ